MKRNTFFHVCGLVIITAISQLGCSSGSPAARFPIGENIGLRNRVIDTTLAHLGRVRITVEGGQLDISYLSPQPRTTLWQIYSRQERNTKQSGTLLQLQPKAFAQNDEAQLPEPECKTGCPEPEPGGPIRIKWVEFPLDGENGVVILCAAIPCGSNE